MRTQGWEGSCLLVKVLGFKARETESLISKTRRWMKESKMLNGLNDACPLW
jgi:hypothetical protein